MPVKTDSNTTNITERKPTGGERFTLAVERQFSAEVGNLQMSAYDKQLAQHLFVKIDAAIIELDAHRKEGNLPIVRENINMRKLAMDAVNRMQLGIDALIPGSIYPIAYFNGKTKQYDLDLRIGYRGEQFYKMNASVKPIKDIRIELVYSKDTYEVHKADMNHACDGYVFELGAPFIEERGELRGGFGHIIFEDGSSVHVPVGKAEIDKYKGKAMGDKFWGEWYAEMAYKTIVHRTMNKIIIDPQKICVSALAKAESDEIPPEPRETPAMEGNEVIDLPPEDAHVDASTGKDGEPF